MKKNFLGRGLSFYLILLIGIFVLSPILNNYLKTDAKDYTYSEILQEIKQNQDIEEVLVKGDTLVIEYKKNSKSGRKQTSIEKEISPYWMPDLLHDLKEAEIKFDYEQPINFASWINLGFSFLMLAALIFFFWFSFAKSSGMGDGRNPMNFGRSRHRTFDPKDKKVTFKDVAGADEEKHYLQEVVNFLKDPGRFKRVGAKVPRGILLMGPPGTGKTLLAKAVAGEANVPFLSISGSDFVEMFVGVGASRVRELFAEAKRLSPAIIFIDEIDAVGRHRGAGMGGGHDEREQTLNQLLVQMDGFSSEDNIIIIAATNRSDILDPALLRPGRFNQKITVNPPDIKGREEILRVHAKDKPLSPSVDLKEFAQITAGFTGADLANLLNEAALNCAKRNATVIEYNDISEALFTVMVGVEKKSRIISKEERKKTAYHEAGHAIVLRTVSDIQRVERVSIISAGNAGGYTAYKPYEDRYYTSKQQMLNSITVALAGRAAEMLIFGELTTGASGDLRQCNAIARDMVCVYGMSERLKNMYLSSEGHEVFLGKDYGHVKNYSNEISEIIDEEVKDILEQCYERALNILKSKSILLETLSQKLLQVEKIDGETFEYLYQKFTTEEQREEDAQNPAVEKVTEIVLKKMRDEELKEENGYSDVSKSPLPSEDSSLKEEVLSDDTIHSDKSVL